MITFHISCSSSSLHESTSVERCEGIGHALFVARRHMRQRLSTWLGLIISSYLQVVCVVNTQTFSTFVDVSWPKRSSRGSSNLCRSYNTIITRVACTRRERNRIRPRFTKKGSVTLIIGIDIFVAKRNGDFSSL